MNTLLKSLKANLAEILAEMVKNNNGDFNRSKINDIVEHFMNTLENLKVELAEINLKAELAEIVKEWKLSLRNNTAIDVGEANAVFFVLAMAVEDGAITHEERKAFVKELIEFWIDETPNVAFTYAGDSVSFNFYIS